MYLYKLYHYYSCMEFEGLIAILEIVIVHKLKYLILIDFGLN